MLWIGGVTTSIYDIGSSQLLVSYQNKQSTQKVQRFFNQHIGAVVYEWNGLKYPEQRNI